MRNEHRHRVERVRKHSSARFERDPSTFFLNVQRTVRVQRTGMRTTNREGCGLRHAKRSSPSCRACSKTYQCKISARSEHFFLNVQRTSMRRYVYNEPRGAWSSTRETSIAIVSGVFKNIQVQNFSAIRALFLKRTTNQYAPLCVQRTERGVAPVT